MQNSFFGKSSDSSSGVDPFFYDQLVQFESFVDDGLYNRTQRLDNQFDGASSPMDLNRTDPTKESSNTRLGFEDSFVPLYVGFGPSSAVSPDSLGSPVKTEEIIHSVYESLDSQSIGLTLYKNDNMYS
ncbi:hypothetical protein Lser_V15G06495 [Lactuca serriola]